MSEFATLLDKIPAWFWVVSLLGVTSLGFVSLWLDVRDAVERYKFSTEFRDNFISYARNGGRDPAAYHQMLLHSNRMQATMGPFGVWDHFRDPPHVYSNYGIILNLLPRIRREFNDDRPFGRVDELVQMFDEALVRFLGSIDDDLKESRKSLRSPVTCFRRGAEQIALLPFLFFGAFGIIGRKTVASIRAAWVFKFLTAVLALLGLTASVIALLVDGSEALGIVRGWFSQGTQRSDSPPMSPSGS
jgi:hypothetical protein